MTSVSKHEKKSSGGKKPASRMPTADGSAGRPKRRLALQKLEASRRRSERELRESEEKYRSLTENVNLGIYRNTVGPKGKFIEANPAIVKMFGYRNKKEFLAASVADLYQNAEGRKKFNETMLRRGFVRNEELRLKKRDGTPFIGSVSAVAVKDAKGRVIFYDGIIDDTTLRKQAEEDLNHSYSLLQAAMESTADGILVVDAEGKIVGFNSRFAQMWRIPEEILVTRSDQKALEFVLDQLSNPEAFLSKVRELYAHPDEESYDTLDFKDGRVFERYSRPQVLDGKPVGRVWSFRDVTASKRLAERITALHLLKEALIGPGELQGKLQTITDGIVRIFQADFARIWMTEEADLCDRGCLHASVKDGPHICRDRAFCLHLMASAGRYTHLDGAHRRVPLGAYKIGRVASGADSRFITNNVSEDPRVHDHSWAESLGLVSFAGYRLLSPAGRPIGVMALFSRQPILPAEEELLEDLANSVSQAIQAGQAEMAVRRAEKKFRTIFENAVDGIYQRSPSGFFFSANPALAKTHGFDSPEEFINAIRDNEYQFYVEPGQREAIKRRMDEQGEVRAFETQTYRKDGSRIWISESARAARDEEGRIVSYDGIVEDITARKLAEGKIKDALREKELLLREIYHRVKNNMQIVSSLLSLQARQIDDPRIREIFKESQGRVRSMALVHEKLYMSKDLSRIDFSSYLDSLTRHLIQSYQVDPNLIHLELNVENVDLDIHTAVPCGLIVNELVSNSLKHAFPEGRKGRIAVELRRLDGRLQLKLGDDGIGFPEGFDLKNTETLGMQIVMLLVSQIEGTIELRREDGSTVFEIVFEELKYAQRL